MNQPEVILEQGTLRGSFGTDLNGDSFYKFQGIPYAKPPLGDLRFKAPISPDKWDGVLDATKEGNPCFQRDPLKSLETYGSEDCLYLNVFSKNLSGELRPVLFWIHGGAFAFLHGGEEYCGPDFLLVEDVVLVTFNYRLGMLDPSLEVPGNAGLKDQVMALRWVRKNISKFGGDPNNVTIFGESAGGAAVHLHVLSPMSRGLFHKAIAQSGSALYPCLGEEPTVPLRQALGEILNLEGADEKTLLDALMSKSKEEILDIQIQVTRDVVFNEPRAISVIVEKNSDEPFLDRRPFYIMKSGRFNEVPYLTGFTNAEGMLYEILKAPKWRPDFEDVIPSSFGYKKGTREKQKIAKILKEFYFGNEELSDDNATRKYDMLGDSNFIFPIYKTVITHLPVFKNPIYLYRVSVESKLNCMKNLIGVKEPGVAHYDDVGYLFKSKFTPAIKPDSLEDISVRKFIKLWSNFAKFGNPTPNKDPLLDDVMWRPVTEPSKIDFLDIGTSLVASHDPEKERMIFWDEIFEKKIGST